MSTNWSNYTPKPLSALGDKLNELPILETNVNGDSFKTGISNDASGKCSACFGDNSKANGNYSFAAGTWVNAFGGCSAVFGNNIRVYGVNNFATGHYIRSGMTGLTYQPMYGHIAGEDHSIDYFVAKPEISDFKGNEAEYNKQLAEYNDKYKARYEPWKDYFNLTNDNTKASHFVHVAGSDHTLINAHSAHVEGFGHNVIDSSRVHLEGLYNTVVEGPNSYVGGQYCDVRHADCFVHGNHLKSTGSAQMLFGSYNDYDNDPDGNIKFAIGGGYVDDRNTDSSTDDLVIKRNLFTVYKDGSAELTTQGSTPNSVVLKRTFDRLIYDVLATKNDTEVGKDVVNGQVEEQLHAWWDAMPSYSVRFFMIWNNGANYLGGGANLIRMFKVDDESDGTGNGHGMIETYSYQNSVTGSGLRRRVIGGEFKDWEHFGNYCVDTDHVATNYVVAPKSDATTDDINNDPDIGGSSLKQKSVLKLLTTHKNPNKDSNSEVGIAIKTALYYPDNKPSETSMQCCVIPHYGSSWGDMRLGTSAHPWSSLVVSNVVPAKTRTKPDGTISEVSANLGTSDNGWNTIYTVNGLVQGSSRKSKENIKNVISESTPMTMNLRDEPAELSDITVETLVDFVRNFQPVTFTYKGDSSQEAEQLGIIADDIAEHPVYKYVGIDRTETVEVTPAEYDEDGNVVTEAVTQEKRVLGLQALPLATVALSVCKSLIDRIDFLEAQLNDK